MGDGLKRHSDQDLYVILQKAGPEAREAFEELYDRYSPQVYRYCRRVLGHHELAEDVFQDTFIRFYRSVDPSREMTNVAAFIMKIARNLCLNARGSKHFGLTSLENASLPATFPHSYEKDELKELIATAVECLPDDYRETFVLKEYNGLSSAEVADILGISVATVKVRLFRARQKLRKLLSPYIADLAD